MDMFTTNLAKSLVEFRVKERGEMRSEWCKKYESDSFFGSIQFVNLLPTACGCHHRDVYNSMGINCNSICINHFKKSDCLIFEDKYVACRVYVCCGASKYSEEYLAEEANNHLGEIYVAFERFSNTGDGEIFASGYGMDLTLDELEQRNPEFLRNLVFNLK